MIFISRKRFEEEVMQRIGKAMDDEYNRKRLCSLEERIDKLDFRITRLENGLDMRSNPPVSGSATLNMVAVKE